MPGSDFLDTNVLLYAYDVTDPRKRSIAQDLIRNSSTGEVVVSSQVLAEFASTLLHKLAPPALPQSVIALLDALAPLKLVTTDGGTVRRAVEVRE